MTDSAPLGIICALPEEIAHLRSGLDAVISGPLGGFHFEQGRLDDVPVVLVEGCVGKVASALAASLLLDRFGCRGLLFSGVAGGLDPALAVGDVVIAERVIQHDYGALLPDRMRPYRPGTAPIGEPRDPIAFACDTALLGRARAALADLLLPELPAAAAGGAARVPRIAFGTILSGDQFINSETVRRRLFTDFAGHAVEMEGGAIAQVAERFDAPVLVVRSLSDLAGHDSHLDFAAFLGHAATTAAMVVRRLVPVF
jgi:adenosylhomocysteine nucleosidase